MDNSIHHHAPQEHERTDGSFRQLAMFAIATAALFVGGLVVSWFTFHYITKYQSLGEPASPFDNTREMPEGPRLQVHAPEDLKQYKQEEKSVLDGYGWVDQKQGIVRIPVDRAMELLLQKGYPVRTEDHKAPAKGAAASANVRSAMNSGKTGIAVSTNEGGN
jgi:hypothetical protein